VRAACLDKVNSIEDEGEKKMRRRNLLKILGATVLLWSSLAFSCGGSTEQGGATDDGGTTQRSSGPDKTGVGKPYESRDPYTCRDASKPTSTRAVAENYRCNFEEVSGGKLHLVENIVVSEMGSPRQYDHYHDMEAWGIDATQPITPIRGSFDEYVCDEVSDYMQNSGKNCLIAHSSDAEGVCYKTASGEWKCIMQDTTTKKTSFTGKPPR
jgi:hypothetical protein